MRYRFYVLAIILCASVVDIPSTSAAVPALSLQERVALRRKQRAAMPRSVTPIENTSTLSRRELRRQRRLIGRLTPIKQLLINATNLERKKYNLPALRFNANLELAAQRHADDMLRKDYFGHLNPDGERVGARLKRIGYPSISAVNCRCSYKVYMGENLAKGQDSIAEVIRQWMASEGHRESILSKNYKEIGIGIIDDIWVQNFGGIEIKTERE